MVKGREPFVAPAGAADYRRRVAASAERNRDPILAVLTRVLPAAGTVLEVASGTGQHAAYFAPRLPRLVWQTSDPDPEMRASIAAWVAGTGAANLKPPLDLDVRSPSWPIDSADAVVAVNMIHIGPWAACEGLLAGAGRLLDDGGILYLYGPFHVGGRPTAPSNAAFDDSLRRRNPEWGVRDVDDVAAAAAAHGLELSETVDMPANNLSVVLRRA